MQKLKWAKKREKKFLSTPTLPNPSLAFLKVARSCYYIPPFPAVWPWGGNTTSLCLLSSKVKGRSKKRAKERARGSAGAAPVPPAVWHSPLPEVGAPWWTRKERGRPGGWNGRRGAYPAHSWCCGWATIPKLPSVWQRWLHGKAVEVPPSWAQAQADAARATGHNELRPSQPGKEESSPALGRARGWAWGRRRPAPASHPIPLGATRLCSSALPPCSPASPDPPRAVRGHQASSSMPQLPGPTQRHQQEKGNLGFNSSPFPSPEYGPLVGWDFALPQPDAQPTK